MSILFKTMIGSDPYPDATIVISNITSANTVFTVRCLAPVGEDIVINWGDGVSTTTAGTNALVDITHTYIDIGTYQLEIIGGTSHRFQGQNTVKKAIKLYSGLTSTQNMFYQCTGMASIDPIFFKIPEGVTIAKNMFYQCTSLTAIPNGFSLPEYCVDVYGMFSECAYLTTLGDTFKLNHHIGNAAFMFYNCQRLVFDAYDFGFAGEYNYWVTHYDRTFFNCKLMTCNAGYLDFTNAETMTECFVGCLLLTKLPINTLSLQKSSIDISYAFRNCTNMTGIVNGNYLWNNTTKTWVSDGCFRNCTGLTNYSDIPDTWK